jgi:hypothetical protein
MYKMSLCPSCVAGVASQPYYQNIADVVLTRPEVDPLGGEPAGKFVISNGADPNTYVAHYMTNTTGGGLTANHYQAYLYGDSVGGNDIAGIFDVYGAGNNWAIMSMNQGRPLDAGRVGYITGTGAVSNIVCNSVNANSIVGFAYTGGAAPAGAVPVATITNGVGFAVTLPAGAIYLYNVLG